MPERFVAQPIHPASCAWLVVDTRDVYPDWVCDQHARGADNQCDAERAAETLNRGCRAEREDECLA